MCGLIFPARRLFPMWKGSAAPHGAVCLLYLQKKNRKDGLYCLAVCLHTMETTRGLVKKLTIFCGIAVVFVKVGKYDIAKHKEERHRSESNTTVGNDDYAFVDKTVLPGFPTNNPNLNYGKGDRESRYVGSGMAYSSRTQGDRLSMMNIFKLRRDNDEK